MTEYLIGIIVTITIITGSLDSGQAIAQAPNDKINIFINMYAGGRYPGFIPALKDKIKTFINTYTLIDRSGFQIKHPIVLNLT